MKTRNVIVKTLQRKLDELKIVRDDYVFGARERDYLTMVRLKAHVEALEYVLEK